jgi:nucleotide-binding universal stress UspA family protein
VIAGYDGTPAGADALALATMLGACLASRVVPVMVGDANDRADAIEADLRERLVVRSTGGGSPARQLYEEADARGASLIAVGSTTGADPGRVMIGGVARRLLHGAPCPIAVAPRGMADNGVLEPRVIAVGYDGSPEATEALGFAAAIGGAAGAALRVVAVHGVPPPQDQFIAAGTSEFEQLQQRLHDAATGLASELRAEPRFLSGPPATTLISESELGVDLMVVGSRGYGPIRSVLLGSVSERLLHGAACPVVVVPRCGSGHGADQASE